MENPKKWPVFLMECLKCGNVNYDDEGDCVFLCGEGRVSIEHSGYNGQYKNKAEEIKTKKWIHL